eukprot:CAMPEP_0114049518 /NCGR_PEP_ID=MMETSP1339-20121228/57976_1 /TAXON_ID=94617 /ORGANISM="Fibrocapsa japonica" /LENGTH=42 /assembly_acc=CAM_ASM_000762
MEDFRSLVAHAAVALSVLESATVVASAWRESNSNVSVIFLGR